MFYCSNKHFYSELDDRIIINTCSIVYIMCQTAAPISFTWIEPCTVESQIRRCQCGPFYSLRGRQHDFIL